MTLPAPSPRRPPGRQTRSTRREGRPPHRLGCAALGGVFRPPEPHPLPTPASRGDVWLCARSQTGSQRREVGRVRGKAPERKNTGGAPRCLPPAKPAPSVHAPGQSDTPSPHGEPGEPGEGLAAAAAPTIAAKWPARGEGGDREGAGGPGRARARPAGRKSIPRRAVPRQPRWDLHPSRLEPPKRDDAGGGSRDSSPRRSRAGRPPGPRVPLETPLSVRRGPACHPHVGGEGQGEDPALGPRGGTPGGAGVALPHGLQRPNAAAAVDPPVPGYRGLGTTGSLSRAAVGAGRMHATGPHLTRTPLPAPCHAPPLTRG